MQMKCIFAGLEIQFYKNELPLWSSQNCFFIPWFKLISFFLTVGSVSDEDGLGLAVVVAVAAFVARDGVESQEEVEEGAMGIRLVVANKGQKNCSKGTYVISTHSISFLLQ